MGINIKMNLTNYLSIIQNEQQYGLPPQRPVQNPRGANQPRIPKQKIPKIPQSPMDPQTKKLNQRPKRTMDQIKNDKFKEEKNKQINPKSYFNYMKWTSNIIKQGEIFRKNCYNDNCSQYQAGTGDRRICKDRCDIETCKRIIQLLKASINKCNQSNDPTKCKQRYQQLIPLYQQKLNKISKKFIDAEKRKQKSDIQVG